MKKLICVVLAFVMVLSFTACGPETAEKAADNALKAIKTLNIKGMEKYFGEIATEEMDLDEVSVDHIKMMKKMLSTMSWEILGSVVEEEDATVTVNVTMVDMVEVTKNVMGELFSDGFASVLDGEFDEDEMQKKAMELFEKELDRDDLKLSTNKLELDMELLDDGWKIKLESSIFGTIIGGFGDMFQ